jgi:hypothetical protein
LIAIFFLGIGLMLVAPMLRRYGMASPVLAGGAFAVLVVAVIGLLHVDAKIGQGAMESNRKEYLFCFACVLPVFILALISRKHFKWAFWLGWGISAAFSLIVFAVIIELEFFWHW